MGTKERIFQAILYEAFAILLSFILLKSTHTEHQSNTPYMLFMLLAISMMAMVWTFFYNIIFDRFFTEDKLSCPVWLRILHIVGFECGLLLFTLPLVMWVMQIGLWQAFLLDISLTVLILVYGFVFYWVYDVVRALLKDYKDSR